MAGSFVMSAQEVPPLWPIKLVVGGLPTDGSVSRDSLFAEVDRVLTAAAQGEVGLGGWSQPEQCHLFLREDGISRGLAVLSFSCHRDYLYAHGALSTATDFYPDSSLRYELLVPPKKAPQPSQLPKKQQQPNKNKDDEHIHFRRARGKSRPKHPDSVTRSDRRSRK
ncbi:MAG: hypothetical protein Q8P67_04160 [archaeon]|nr:hypothetical protein [archaeon]